MPHEFEREGMVVNDGEGHGWGWGLGLNRGLDGGHTCMRVAVQHVLPKMS